MTDVVKGDLYIGINSDLADRLGADCKHQRETEARSRAASLEGMRPKKKKKGKKTTKQDGWPVSSSTRQSGSDGSGLGDRGQ